MCLFFAISINIFAMSDEIFDFGSVDTSFWHVNVTSKIPVDVQKTQPNKIVSPFCDVRVHKNTLFICVKQARNINNKKHE